VVQPKSGDSAECHGNAERKHYTCRTHRDT
jgi:hypothetical protein